MPGAWSLMRLHVACSAYHSSCTAHSACYCQRPASGLLLPVTCDALDAVGTTIALANAATSALFCAAPRTRLPQRPPPASGPCTPSTAVLSTAPGGRTVLRSPSGTATLQLKSNGMVSTIDTRSGRTIATLTGPYNQCAQPARWGASVVVLPGGVPA
jgi:hypothetical protein